MNKNLLCSLAGAFILTGAANAAKLEITYENLSAPGGLWNTPLFLGFHDGSFDTFDPGVAASSSLEALAEEGMPGGLVGDIAGVAGAQSAVLFGDDAPSAGPGVLFNPGSSASIIVDLLPTSNRYLSFASMLLPSNDAFIGNANPTAYDLFDINGDFKEGFSISIYGMNVWDSGTEENDTMGVPFSAIGGTSAPTVGGVVAQHSGLQNFIGSTLGNGSTLTSAFDGRTAIGRITARSVPDTSSYIGVMSIALVLGFRRFTRKK